MYVIPFLIIVQMVGLAVDSQKLYLQVSQRLLWADCCKSKSETLFLMVGVSGLKNPIYTFVTNITASVLLGSTHSRPDF
jgi:hypothetical protein